MIRVLHPSFLIPFAALLWTASLVASLALGGDSIWMRMASIVAAVASGAALLYAARPLSWPRGAILPALVVAGVWAACSVAWSGAMAVTIMQVPAFLTLPFLVVAVASLRGDHLTHFARWACAGGFAVMAGLSLWALAQYFIWPQLLVSGQVREPFANPNMFATFLNCGIFSALAVALSAPKARWMRVIPWVFIALALAAQTVICSRGALFVLTGGMAVLAFLEPARMRAHWKPALLCLIVAGAVMAATLPNVSGAQKTMPARLEMMVDDPAMVWTGRASMWDGAIGVIRTAPVLGTGYGTFFLHYPAARSAADRWSGGFMAHSDFLQFWAELGIPGAALFVLILGAALVRMAAARRGGNDTPSRAAAAALFCGIGAVVTHSIFDFPFYTLPVLLAVGVMMGAWFVLVSAKDGVRTSALTGHRYGDMALTAMLAAGLCVWAQIMLSERAVMRADQAFQRDDINAFAPAVNESHVLGMGLNDRSYVLAARVPMGILVGKGSRAGETERRGLVKQVDDLLRSAIRYNPYRPATYFQRAELAHLATEKIWPADAPGPDDLLRHALRVDPRFLPARMRLADHMARDGDPDGAFALLRDGLIWVYEDRMAEAFPYYDRVLGMAASRGLAGDADIKAAAAERDRLKDVAAARPRKAAKR